MKQSALLPWISALSLTAALVSCGGGSGGGSTSSTGGSNAFFIVSCSLGCSSGVAAQQISCGLNAIFVNEELVIEFSQPVDFATVTKSTFKIVNIETGKTPIGSYEQDPVNPKLVIFRPQVTFDSTGNPIFGLEQGKSYQLDIPGTAQSSSGSFIKGTSGLPNQARMFCTLVASKGVKDAVPGSPTATVTVTKHDQIPDPNNPGQFLDVFPTVAADNATSVWLGSKITFVFNDVMNPATLANPVTQESPTIGVFVDSDGNITDPTDQVQVFGSFEIDPDPENLKTTVIFTPSVGLPSAGTGALPRKVVVNLPSSIKDLGGNSLSNFGTVAFEPELVAYSQVILPDGTGEQFVDEDNLDSKRSGAVWLLPTPPSTIGALLPSVGGGSGRLGDLVVKQGTTKTLSTTSADFTDLAELTLTGAADPDPSIGATVSVTDGIFEFKSVTLDNGSVLRFTGTNPARLYAMGECQVRGLIDVSGAAPIADTATLGQPGWDKATGANFTASKTGGLGGVGGPGAGDGGKGGDRPDNTGQTTLLNLVGDGKGITNPGAVIDGQPGEGVGGGASSLAGGNGSVHYPATLPTSTNPVPVAPPFQNQIYWDLLCQADLVSAPGSGGGYSTSGSVGVNKAPNDLIQLSFDLLAALTGPLPTPGDATALDPTLETLAPEQGKLIGGAGGGGAGAHVAFTKSGGQFGACFPAAINAYFSHSGAGGGGGGGALQIQAGARIQLDGALDASGGVGGSAVLSASNDPSGFARPGGGGSGGGILLQTKDLQIVDVPGRVDVAGGAGGIGNESTRGGAGGAGYVRLETLSTLDLTVQAAKILPYEPSTATYGGADSDVILSQAIWTPKFSGPSALSGAQSCWIRPEGNFFRLTFLADDIPNNVYGWDMQIVTPIPVPGLDVISWRQPLPLLNDVSPEQFPFIGSDLKGPTPSPVVVRFQGARSIKAIDNLCDVDIHDSAGPILPGSVTGWVRHPAELNDYWSYLGPSQSAKLTPNMIRWEIVFDRTTGLVPLLILGITNLQILAQPD